MKFQFALFALATVTQAAPTFTPTDTNILTYALVLEHLEDNFYRQGLAKFGRQMDAHTRKNIQRVSRDEASHVAFLKAALGAKAVPACTYKFPMNDLRTFLATAAVLEGVGVSAYLGAAGDIMNKAYLGAAASILTVEARHASFIHNRVGQAAFPAPYDVGQNYRQVFTLAAGFIDKCSFDTGLRAFPSLTVAKSYSGIYSAGQTIHLTPGKNAAKPSAGKQWKAAFTIPGKGYAYSPVMVSGGKWSTKIPKGAAGQTYVIVTSGNAVSDDNTVAGPAIIEVSDGY